MKADIGDTEHRYIVGIGASAGGLEALQKLLTVLAPNTGFPYVIVQHLSPDYKSMLVHILAKHTRMEVSEAEDGTLVRGDHVYIIPPGKLMTIADGRLHLTDQIGREFGLPIDTFFYSLAEEAGSRAIAVVLSGTGSDGSNGIKAVKERDGLVIAQDLDSSKFDGMPRSAMRTGLVDAQITPEEIALELKYISDASKYSAREIAPGEADQEMMARVCAVLKKTSNINFANYKQNTIIRRMERRRLLCHKDDMASYVEFLYQSPDEARILSREILIGVTGFFRDPELFESLKEKAIPEILNRSTPDEPVRVWVAGCSTGEEAYSIAILFSEVMEALKLKRSVKIFATDLDADSIEVAGKGVYGDNIVESVSPIRLARYFTRKNNTYAIKRDIRWMIVFSVHNVTQDPPFGRLDLISCRNMLVYFQPAQQNSLFSIFHKSLRDGGFLFLGKSEAIGAYTEAFPVVDPAAKIFTHKKNVKITGAPKVAVPRFKYSSEDEHRIREESVARAAQEDNADEAEENAVAAQLMRRFMPSSVVVNQKNELVSTYGDNRNYVRLAAGRFSKNLFDVLTVGLTIPVSTLLKQARETKSEQRYAGIHFKGETENSVIDLTIMPVGGDKSDGGSFALVFEKSKAVFDEKEAAQYDVNKAAVRRIADLEQDMAQMKSRLEQSASEQECVNTELQAANEELLTANEELQSSNEELQSVNEELYTVNAEYQQKLGELNGLNDDLANFLSSTLTGILFVDERLNIRRYTDYMTSEFSVMEQDVGRSLALLSYHFPSTDLIGICSGVLKTLEPDEREVATGRGKTYFMRVSPYRSTDNRIMGCVLTLMDVTSQKRGRQTLLDTEKRLSIARQAIDAKSDYLIRVSQSIQTPVSVLRGISASVKRLARDNPAIMVELDKMEENISYINAIVFDMSQLSISERLGADRSDKSVPASVVDDVASCVCENGKARGSGRVYDGAASLAGGRVLLAEDNALNRTVLKTMLENAGIDYKEATNGQEALEAYLSADDRAFSCVLMDVRMPKLDGISAATGIRASDKEDARTVPIIGVLTKGYEEDMDRALAGGMDGCVTKPIDPDALFPMMAKLVKKE